MNPLQKAVVRRKISYFVAIVSLFTISMFWRGTFALGNTKRAGPAPTPVHAAADWLGSRAIASQATNLELRELEQGEAELGGEALRLGLTGSRGFVTAYLWREAIEKQKRGELAELEVLVRMVTKLQPHFLSPWLFQSWNIAYNVSVDQHRLGDMYFYIARGIDLLAEGERRNKRSPDMRYWIAFSYQNKFGVSDKVQTLRCLFQMSCIPPNERSPQIFRDKDGSIDLVAFRKFCDDNPHLVRRLREKLNCRTPSEVVEFLDENRKVPSRFKNDAGDYAADDQQFPILPPKFDEGPDEWKPGETGPDDDKSGFRAARAWYAYSLLLVPPSPKWDDGRPIPGPSPKPGPPGRPEWDEYDATLYRMPKSPMLIIFRQGAPRSQAYQADMEGKEGWFDDSGWRPDAGVDEKNRWFPRRPGEPDAVFGANRSWSAEQWRDAYRRWQLHGEKNALVIDPGRWEAIREAAGGDVSSYPASASPAEMADPESRRRYIARMGVFFFGQNRQVTNFAYFLTSAEAEMQPAAVVARKALWEAEQARQSGNTTQAIRKYTEAFDRWKEWLSRYSEYHQYDSVQEEMYEAEYRYLRLLTQDDPRVRERAREKFETAFWAVAPVPPAIPRVDENRLADLRQEIAELEMSPFGKPKPNGEPWIKSSVKDTVKSRLGTAAKPATDQAPPPPPTPGT